MLAPSQQRAISDVADDIHAWAVEKGWWEGGERNLYEQIALMHSELSEALEALRAGYDPHDVFLSEGGKPEGFAVELADCVIRIMDTCANYNLDLGMLIDLKMTYNATRPYRHGGKRA